MPTFYNHNFLFTAGFFVRAIVYIVIFAIYTALIAIGLTLSGKYGLPFTTGSLFLDRVIFFSALASPLIFVEWRIRVNRKKLGLSLYKNISDDLLHLELNKTSSDKKDLNYWFELKEKGAISDDEYQVKKKELL
ncbi:hypothetical protein GCM10012288_17180 [Malaciobacter pacificus]|uniref:Uncharacterized protein n=1 Tax=Malaciobacter pacificus TaxID=1080223 RepID=A0A5C2HBK9_9BACT|nr:SHOCT domain-containing protein [Malaciobacter pacificus]QEP34905.1 hypothetical protein APAC_1824 [Malaciobacter pacificus]GGD43435.1 hypothetical protein GCM10012288_17180 [Malaciobacter pacificus]